MTTGLVILIAIATFLTLAYLGRPYWAFFATAAIGLSSWAAAHPGSSWAFWTGAATLAGIALVLGFPPLRRRLVTRNLMPVVAGLLPRMGETERIALEAGTVGWDGELFSGRPDWSALLDFRHRPLTEAESAFLDGPVQALCEMLDDWTITRSGDLPPEVWSFLREQRFFGMVVSEQYGGLGFSAQAHSAVVEKIASRSVTAAVTVMVPNSLGPAELLIHYGTDAQRDYYLPRLARGEEVPCFALTGPEAGSDAAATQSEGIVCHGKWQGEEVLGLRLRWRKRYITLAPVATLIGLAFKLRDPDGLLGDDGGGEDRGITCALIPADLPGIEIGRRHDPMGVPFQNGPITGENVFVPLDAIIGGREGVGQGWRMLMETLAAGRAISLPSVASAGAKISARVTSAYAMVREQFDTPIGRFEGIEEPLARIGGLTYLVDAARCLTLGAVDAGEKPAVPSAIVKAYCTEAMRSIVNDAMDVRAGAAIMRGPRNILGRIYSAIPIGITVEGANILTRSMIIYGQGAIRCHPFVLDEIRAVETNDLRQFDAALSGHIGFALTTLVRTLLLGITRGRTLQQAPRSGELRRLIQRLARASAAFSLASEVSMATLGGQLKRREKITGRLADALAGLYLGSAALKRFVDNGELDGDRPMVFWAVEHALERVETALSGVVRNLPNRPAAWLLGLVVFPTGRRERGPDDARGGEVAAAMLDDVAARERLTSGIFLPNADEPGLGRLESALEKARPALEVEARLRRAVREGRLDHAPGKELARAARAAGLIGESELQQLELTREARDEAIRVDSFDRLG